MSIFMYTCLILLVIVEYKRRNKSLIFLFNLWWLVILLISYLNLGEFYPINKEVYLMILVGIMTITLTIKILGKGYNKNQKYIKNLKINFLIELIYLLVNIYFFIKLNFLINIFDNYGRVRLVFFNIDDFGVRLFSHGIVTYSYNFLKALSFFNFLLVFPLSSNGIKKKFFYINVINIILFCIISGGRDILVYIFVLAIYSFKIRELKKNFKYIITFSMVILIITYLREGSLIKLYWIIITYFTGSIAYFSELLKQNSTNYYYGKLFFSSLFLPIRFFKEIILGINYIDPLTEVSQKMMIFTQISVSNPYSKVYNALPTMFYWFYIDLGKVGIVLFSFIIGFIGVLLRRKLCLKNKQNLMIISYYEFLLIFSIFSNKFMDIFLILPLCLYYVYRLIKKGKY